MEACPELGTPAIPVRPCNSGRPDAAFRLINGVGIATSRISELSLHGLLPRCVRFAPTSHPVNGNTRYGPACSLWPGGTYTRWIPFRSFTVSSSVPLLPRFSQRDNEAGRCQEFFCIFLKLLNFSFLLRTHPRACARAPCSQTDHFQSSLSDPCHPTRSVPCHFITSVLPTNHLFDHCGP